LSAPRSTWRAALQSTHGYEAMWAAVGVPIVLSLAFLPALERVGESEPVFEPARASHDELALSA